MMTYFILLTLLIISLIIAQMSGVMIILVSYFILTYLLTYVVLINNIFNLSINPQTITVIYTVMGTVLAINLIDSLFIKKNLTIPQNKVNLFIFLYFIIILISLVLAPFKLGARTSFFSVIQFIILFLIMIVLVNDEKFIHFMIRLNIFTFSTIIIIFLILLNSASTSERSFITFGSAVGLMPILWIYRMISDKLITRIFCDVMNIIIIIMLFYSGHRRYLIAVVGAFFIFMVFEKKRFFKANILLVVIGLIVLPKHYSQTRLAQRQYTFESIIKTKGKKGTEGRYELWKEGIKLFKKYPVFGVGFRESQYILGNTFSKAGSSRKQIRLHNTYLATLVDTGIGGFLCYLMILYFIMDNLYRSRKIFIKINNLKMSYFSLAYLSSSFAGLFVAFFGSSGPNDKGFWTQLAMSVIFLEVAKTQEKNAKIIDEKVIR